MAVLMYILVLLVVVYLLAGIRVLRPTEKGVIERLGRYKCYKSAGFVWIAIFFERLIKINITERLADILPQDIITKDNLNARVDLMVYYKVRQDELNIKKSLYNVNDFKTQVIALAQTTARNVIGGMMFTDVNSKRNLLNVQLAEILDKQSDAWGVEIVRVEMKEITPPRDVQDTMNKVIKAQNEKDAAIDFATSVETRADGEKRARIKEAEGVKQSTILKAG
jgi:regulator of protease activity HflC (stomatin/prohibitin superfamily)